MGNLVTEFGEPVETVGLSVAENTLNLQVEDELACRRKVAASCISPGLQVQQCAFHSRPRQQDRRVGGQVSNPLGLFDTTDNVSRIWLRERCFRVERNEIDPPSCLGGEDVGQAIEAIANNVAHIGRADLDYDGLAIPSGDGVRLESLEWTR